MGTVSEIGQEFKSLRPVTDQCVDMFDEIDIKNIITKRLVKNSSGKTITETSRRKVAED